jgi:hypothetical protein
LFNRQLGVKSCLLPLLELRLYSAGLGVVFAV